MQKFYVKTTLAFRTQWRKDQKFSLSEKNRLKSQTSHKIWLALEFFSMLPLADNPLVELLWRWVYLCFGEIWRFFLEMISRWALEPTPCFCRLFLDFFFECHKIWFLGCFSLLCSLLGRYLLTNYQFILNFCENWVGFVSNSVGR